MLFHLLVALAMLASVIAFVILWYFWIKKKLELANVLEGEHQVLFPFKHFAWLFIGLIVVTCLVQVHFTRVSSGVYEDLNAMASFLEEHRGECMNIRELDRAIKDLRKDVNTRFDGLKELSEKTIRTVAKNTKIDRSQASTGKQGLSQRQTRKLGRASTVVARSTSPKPPQTQADKSTPKKNTNHVMFAGAARAAATSTTPSTDPVATSSEGLKQEKESAEQEVLSMKLDLKGLVKANVLLVRQEPDPKAPVVDKIRSGEIVSVSEKRIVEDQMWYAITTPQGKNGWVNYRYLKLQTNPTHTAKQS